jgi:hypothetical protein
MIQVLVPPELFDEMEQQWAPPDDPVFQMAPPTFEAQAQLLYSHIGRPPVSSQTFWAVYSALLDSFRSIIDIPQSSNLLILPEDSVSVDDTPLLPNLNRQVETSCLDRQVHN